MKADIYPRVTVAIPTWNRARHLPETLDSLLAQRYPDLEVIVVDDGSTDDTRAVVGRYVDAYPAVFRYFHQANAGEAAATNFAWAKATGRFFCLVCSDDPQPSDLLRTSVEFFAQNPGIIVSYPDWWRLDEAGRRVEKITVPEYSVERLVADCECFVGPGAMIDRSAVYSALPELRDPAFRLVSDYSSWLRLCRLGRFARIPAPIAAWRDHPNGATSLNRGRNSAREHVALVLGCFDDTVPPEIRQYELRAKARIHQIAANLVGRRDVLHWLRYHLLELRFIPPVELPRRFRRR